MWYSRLLEKPPSKSSRLVERVGQLRLVGVVGRERTSGRGRFRVVQALHVVAAELVDFVVVGAELPFRRDLPGDADQRAADELIVDALAAVVDARCWR